MAKHITREQAIKAAQYFGREGGQARARALSPLRRSEIAQAAARARWNRAPTPAVAVPQMTWLKHGLGWQCVETMEIVPSCESCGGPEPFMGACEWCDRGRS